MKKVFIISTILLIVVLIFLGIYNFAFNGGGNTIADGIRSVPGQKDNEMQSAQDAATQPDSGDNTTSVQKKEEHIIPVTEHRVLSPAIGPHNEKIRFYDKDTGRIFEVPIIGGSERVFSDVPLSGLVYAAWAPDKHRVLTKFVNNGDVRVYMFDHRTGRGKQLKHGIDRIDWTVIGDHILYTFFDQRAQRTTLNVADPDGQNWRVLADDIAKGTRFVNVQQSSRVAFWRPPNPFEETELKVVNLLDATPKPKTIFKGHYNADFLFSPNGERILISSTQKRGSKARMLGVANANGGEYHPLHIPTNVNKCTWAANSRIVYCAYPTGDRDTFWKIDVTTNKKKRVIDLGSVVNSSTRYQAFDLFLDPEGQALFFTNAIDGRLYRIAL